MQMTFKWRIVKDILFGVLVKVSGDLLVEHFVPFIDVVDFSILIILLGSFLLSNAVFQVSSTYEIK